MFLRRTAVSLFLLHAAFLVPSFAHACGGSLHIELKDAGVYSLDYVTIVAKQPALADCRSDDLFLIENGKEVPIRIVGDNEGRLADSGQIQWVGKRLHGTEGWFDAFSAVNVYLLSAKPGVHERMRPFASSPASAPVAALWRNIHLEKQELLIRLDQSTMKHGEEPDVWHWGKLTYLDPNPFSLDFDLPDFNGQHGAASATATLTFRGTSRLPWSGTPENKPPEHVVELALNGKPLPNLEWDGRDEIKRDVKLPVALLKPTGNQLHMRLSKRYLPSKPDAPLVDVVMFDSADLAYPINGNLDANDAPFDALAATPGVHAIELTDVVRRAGSAKVAFYSDAGEYRAGVGAGSDDYRLAASTAETRIYPVVADRFLQPLLVRAVTALDLRDPGPGYDYLMVAHSSLLDAIQPLAEFHRQRGLRVAVVNVDDIYDEFNGGIVHPRAIRELIEWGRSHWQVKPRYVLLVGTASFDVRHNETSEYNEHQVLDPRTGVGKVKRVDTAQIVEPAAETALLDRNLVPTWQVPSPDGQSASDNGYVALKEGDFHPMLAIGRFPVVTPAEVAVVVKKTIDYASHPAPGAWRAKAMFITNESTHFQKVSDDIAVDIERQGFTAEKVYASANEQDNVQHQTDIKANLNHGNLLVHFLGHGGRFIWRSGPPDFRKNHDLFTLDDVSALSNGDRLPMVLSMTCYSGSFDNPNSDTIGERFLRVPDKGAIAVFAASWRNSPNPSYSKDIVEQLLEPGQTIGDAIVAAKQKSNDRVLVETYNLFGDPAVVLDRPRGAIAMASDSDRWNDRIAVRLPNPDFHGKVTVNWIDEHGTTLDTQTYSTRDRQFVLPVPSKNITEVNVYAEDLSSGADAIGSLDLRPPAPLLPAKKVAIAKKTGAPNTAAPNASPSPSKTNAVPIRQSRPSNLPDKVAQFDFERNPETGHTEQSPEAEDDDEDGEMGQAATASTRDPAVPVNPGAGKGEQQK